MLEPDFALTLEHRAGGTTILVLAGELDLYRAPEIERALAEAIEPEPAQEGQGNRVLLPAFGGYISDPRVRRVVVDLRAVTFLDSTTLALLLAASGARSRGRAARPRRAAYADDRVRGNRLRPPPHDQAGAGQPIGGSGMTATYQTSPRQEPEVSRRGG